MYDTQTCEGLTPYLTQRLTAIKDKQPKRLTLEDLGLMEILQSGTEMNGLTLQFVRFGIAESLALQLTFGALWHEKKAIDGVMEVLTHQLPEQICAQIIGCISAQVTTT